jgi:hypothetical protein
MRQKIFRVLLALLAVSFAVGPSRSRAIPPPTCLQNYQECVGCGSPEFQMLCTHYDCEDGSERVFCGQCRSLCIVP